MSEGESSGSVLDQLFPGSGGAVFVKDHFGKRPLVVRGPRERFGLEEEDTLFDPAKLFERGARGSLNAYVQKANGQSYHLRIEGESAKAVYDFGGTVEISGVLETFPALRAMTDRLKGELGVNGAAAVILVSPPGKALPTHFDQQDVFVFHLTGRKRWRIARNDVVPFPLNSYFPRVRGAGRDDAHWPSYFPATMPTEPIAGAADVIDVVLEPGTLAYVPRGWWHQTEAVETSISITVLCTPQDFTALFLERLKVALIQNADFRRPVVVPANAARREETATELADLIARAASLAATMPVEEMMGRPFADQHFARASGTALVLEKDGAQNVAKVLTGSRLTCEVEIDEESVSLCTWLAEVDAFQAREMLERAQSVALAESVVALMVDAGYLVRA